jgi:spore germination cell wall hydrolase CwlJ-like protein
MTTEEKALFLKLTPLQIMACTILGEAEGEKFAGKLGVGFVIRNRADLWKLTVPEVCLQNNQFECFNTGNPRLPVLVDMARDFEGNAVRLHDSLTAAQGVLSRNLLSSVKLSTFYKRAGLHSPWFQKATGTGNIRYVCTVGNHDFYDEPARVDKKEG